MKDYHDLYLKCYVLSLFGVFEKLRNNSSKIFGLCPNYYLSVPSLSWDAMLKLTKIQLELIRDSDIYSLRREQELKFLIFLIDAA